MGGGHECAHLLVPRLDDLGITLGPIEGAEKPVDAIPGVAEDAVDAPLGEAVQDVIGDFNHTGCSCFS